MKTFIISIVVASLVSVVVALLIDMPGKHWWDFVTWLPLLIASSMSRNPHQPSELVFYLCIFLELFVAIGVISFIGSILYHRNK